MLGTASPIPTTDTATVQINATLDVIVNSVNRAEHDLNRREFNIAAHHVACFVESE
jgi:hypothetical protein